MGRKKSIESIEKKMEKARLNIEAAREKLDEKLLEYDELRKQRETAIAAEISEAISEGRLDYDDFRRLLDSKPGNRKNRSKRRK